MAKEQLGIKWLGERFCALWTMALDSAVHGLHMHAFNAIANASMLSMNLTAPFVTSSSTLALERYELNRILGHPPWRPRKDRKTCASMLTKEECGHLSTARTAGGNRTRRNASMTSPNR